MENLIEELTKVNPANLSEEGLKLFNKINEIIDRNEESEKLYNIAYTGGKGFERQQWKEKIEKKIKELNKEEKEKLKGVKGQDRYFIKQMYQAKRSVIEELLQEGDK